MFASALGLLVAASAFLTNSTASARRLKWCGWALMPVAVTVLLFLIGQILASNETLGTNNYSDLTKSYIF